MKLTFQRDDAVRLLERVSSIIPRRHTVPILTHILLEADGQALTVRGSSLEMEAFASIPADVEEGGSLSIPGDRFATIVRNLQAGAKVSMELQGAQVSVKSGRSAYKLPWLSAGDFPRMDADELPAPVQMTTADLAPYLAKTAGAASNSEARPGQCGVRLAAEDGKVIAAATDGMFLSVLSGEAPEGLGAMPGATIPNMAVTAIGRILADGELALVTWNERLIRVTAGGVTLTSKLIDYGFANYARMIPADYDAPFRVTTEDLRSALGRAAPFADERDQTIALEYGPDWCGLRAANDAAGMAAHEVIACDGGEGERCILFSAQTLKRALSVVGGPVVEFHRHFVPPLHVVRLADPEEPGQTIIVATLAGGQNR